MFEDFEERYVTDGILDCIPKENWEEMEGELRIWLWYQSDQYLLSCLPPEKLLNISSTFNNGWNACLDQIKSSSGAGKIDFGELSISTENGKLKKVSIKEPCQHDWLFVQDTTELKEGVFGVNIELPNGGKEYQCAKCGEVKQVFGSNKENC